MPRLLSVNVGLPRDVTWNGKTVRTAVWKSPVTERRMVRKLNIDGDAHDTTQEAAMSTNVVRSIDTSVARVDLKFEAVVIPVSDVDRAKEFYKSLGWRFDADFRFDNGFRIVQFTPPGSGCSVQFGTNITTAVPGSARGLYLVASDIEAARNELAAHAVEVSDVFHAGTPGAQFQPDGTGGRVRGPSPDHATYSSFATFNDPDGNGWLLQEVTTRLPGRIDPAAISFGSAGDLASALRRSEAAHGQHEKRTGQRDANWSDWYAAYMVAEQAGTELPK
ncbi:MAG TPA: VOC family protein [Candidatus Elarobacter sp.]|nr:VOC family protein [Candidatus Elarobacter sp.]